MICMSVYQINFRQVILHGSRLFCLSLLWILAACSKPAQKTEDIRPVRVMLLNAEHVDEIVEFPGSVQARYESQLGFRVGGKIIVRKVDVGAMVKRGQVLMQLDPQDLQLAQAQAVAAARSAQSARDMAQADFKRYQELRDKNFVSQSVLEAKDTAFKAAQSAYEQAQAAFQSQRNQTTYATLTADVAGVVTSVSAEAGQVVTAGTPVVKVARQGAREVLIGIPENRIDALRRSTDVWVRLWADPAQRIKGIVREVSPIADAITRTYTVKVAIPDDTPNVKLGMTAYVAFASKAGGDGIKVPLTALLQNQGQSLVWVVDNGAVRQVPVQISGQQGNDVFISGELSTGQQVVTAGVNQLQSGQKVSILNSSAVSGAMQ